MANDTGRLAGTLRDGVRRWPVPFKDVADDVAAAIPAVVRPPTSSEHDVAAAVSAMPARVNYNAVEMRCFKGFWVMERWAPALFAMERGFVARRPHGGGGDVVLASLPKAGTTWLKSLAFATLTRGAWPPSSHDHPLRRLNPHDCVPFLEDQFEQGREVLLDELPSPRLLATHMPLSLLPSSIADCKIVYICRDEKDRTVSLWQFLKRVRPDMSLLELYKSCCEGTNVCGPSWHHILEYWKASNAEPGRVLFLTYENVLQHPCNAIRKLALFLGQLFSDAEEEAGVVAEIANLCSLENLRKQKANNEGSQGEVIKFPHDSYFRNGVVGDWVNHMTSEMGERMDAIFQEKLNGYGLTI